MVAGQWIKKLRLGPILGLFIAGYLAWSLAQIVRRNHELQMEITKLKSQIAEMETERADLEYRIRYYQTDAFKEKEARAKLGLQSPGEHVIVLPRQEATPASEEETERARSSQSNSELWWEFIFGAN